MKTDPTYPPEGDSLVESPGAHKIVNVSGVAFSFSNWSQLESEIAALYNRVTFLEGTVQQILPPEKPKKTRKRR